MKNAPLENCAREEIHSVTKKKYATEIHREIISTYGSHAIDFQSVDAYCDVIVLRNGFFLIENNNG